MKTWYTFLLTPMLALAFLFSLPAHANDAPVISGTIWRITDSDGDHCVYEFAEGGKLRYTSPTGYFENGSWEQSGFEVHLEFNNKYVESEGKLSQNGMNGTARNSEGKTWTWTAVMIGRLLSK